MSDSTKPRLKRLLIEAMAKHLPPSASTLRLLDVNGGASAVLSEIRGDLDVVSVTGQADQWPSDPIPLDSVDAVVAYGYVLNDAFLEVALEALRPGGRLIIVNSAGEVHEELGKRLESAGYARILVETAVECPLPTGLLMRGEKPHTTHDTLDRVQQVAELDADRLDLTTYKGRYIHLLIQQTPNKPAWKLESDEPVKWQAAALETEDGPTLLAFSSLPKAVGFLQPAVLAGKVKDVNKVGKFNRETASNWTLPVLLNPDKELLDANPTVFVPVDPKSAEVPDE